MKKTLIVISIFLLLFFLVLVAYLFLAKSPEQIQPTSTLIVSTLTGNNGGGVAKPTNNGNSNSQSPATTIQKPLGQVSYQDVQKLQWQDLSYIPDPTKTSILNSFFDHSGVGKILIFFSPESENAKEELPKIMNVLTAAGFSQDRILWYTVNERVTEPKELIQKWHFNREPTLIVLFNDQEVGRIEGGPMYSWEKDLDKIIGTINN